MIQLAEEFFATKNDPEQISVTPEVMERLRHIHPASLSEYNDGNGPVAWVLLIPTTHYLMERFVAEEISEQELLDETPLEGKYDAIYLCSALVLPEHRGKGHAKRLMCDAIKVIRKNHPIEHLFYWAFSEQGEKLAASGAEALGIPLHSRPMSPRD